MAAFRKVFSKTYSKSTSRQCPVCNKEFVNRRAVLQHALKKTSCNQALDEATVTAFDEEISRKYSQPNSKQCPVCNKEFVNRQAMLEHALHKASCSSVLDKTNVVAFRKEFSKKCSKSCKASEFEAHINKLDDSAKWAVQNWIATDNGHTIAEAIKSGKAIAVSDGSYKNNLGTAAFVI